MTPPTIKGFAVRSKKQSVTQTLLKTLTPGREMRWGMLFGLVLMIAMCTSFWYGVWVTLQEVWG